MKYVLCEFLCSVCDYVVIRGVELVRRWVTARKSIAGLGPVVRFEMPVEVEVLCLD